MDKPSTNTGITARFPIWEPGKYTSVSGDDFEFTAADLQATAQAYNPARFAAPWVIGHPEVDDPAQGWIDRLVFDGQSLIAESSKISPEFAAAHRAGGYRKTSPRFFLPSDPNNPAPGTYYLRHLGWLGARMPARINQAPADFAAPAGCFAADSDTPDDLFHKETVMPHQPDPKFDERKQAEIDAAFAAREQEIKDKEAAFAAREQAIEKREAEQAVAAEKARQADLVAFCSGLADEKNGQLLPSEVNEVAAVLAALPHANDHMVAFAGPDGGELKKQPLEMLKGFLQGLPKQRVPYGEHAGGDAAFAAGDADTAQIEAEAKAAMGIKA